MAGKVAFAKLNTEEDPASGAKYDIHSIPTLLLYRGGQEIDRISGALAYEQLMQWIEHGLRP
jgi:thioredoxin 2